MEECLNGFSKPGSCVIEACDSAKNCWCPCMVESCKNHEEICCLLGVPFYLTHLAIGCAVYVPIELACYASSYIGCASINCAKKAMIKRKLKKNEKHLKDITPQ
ncbi:hypothetical protein niasHS_015800 [Heterodera schachtii]